jgi:putative DNA primase/helicase
MALAQAVLGSDFRAAAMEVERLAGGAGYESPPNQPSEEDNRRMRRQLWKQSSPATMDDPVGLYLRKRLGVQSMPMALRYHQSLHYRNGESKAVLPGMLAIVADMSGQPVTMHRTYLTKAGAKAPVEFAKKLLPGDMPTGAAIRLTPVAPCLGIAEGIETAIAATILTGVPCWSAVTALGLSRWMPPADVTEVVVFGDNDQSYTGHAAAYVLARRLTAKKLAVDVSVPQGAGDDWADVRARELSQKEQA